MALRRFELFRSFYGSKPRAEKLRLLKAPFATGFIKSDCSIWADIKLDESLKCLCGTIDATYQIDKGKKHIGIISWNTSECIELPIAITNEKSPFFHSQRTLLQKLQCQSHLQAAILESKYDVTVTANIIHLRDDDFDVHPVDDWRNCECVSLFEFN